MKNRLITYFLALFTILLSSSHSWAGEVLRLQSKKPKVVVLIEYGEKSDTKIPVNKLVALKVIVKSREALGLTSFDAIMPEHKHGMVSKAKIKKLSDNTYEVTGVMLHMAGHWIIVVNLADKKGKVYSLTQNYIIS